jgi:hypothetical protein
MMCTSLAAFAILGGFILQLISTIVACSLISCLREERQEVELKLLELKATVSNTHIQNKHRVDRQAAALEALRVEIEEARELLKNSAISIWALEAEIHDIGETLIQEIAIVKEIVDSETMSKTCLS